MIICLCLHIQLWLNRGNYLLSHMCLSLIVRYLHVRPDYVERLSGCRYELTHSEYVSKLPKGKHSTKGNYICYTTENHYCIVAFNNTLGATEVELGTLLKLRLNNNNII